MKNDEEQEIDMDIDNHNFGEVKHVSDTDESCVVFTSVVIYQGITFQLLKERNTIQYVQYLNGLQQG